MLGGGNNFVLWGCLSGDYLLGTLSTLDEDPAQCVYQAVDLTAAGQLI
jgi:hypothetical protein